MSRSTISLTAWSTVLIAVSCGCGPKAPDTIRIPLKLKVGAPPKIISDGIGYETVGTTPPPKPDIRPPVPGCELRFVGLSMKRVPVAFTLKKGTQRIDRLWADLNGNSAFDASEEAFNAGPTSRLPNVDYIKFKSVQKVRGRDLPIMMVAEGHRGLGFLQNSYVYGKTTLAGKQIRIRLRDTDYDGLYGMSTGFASDRIEYWVDKQAYQTDPSSFLALGYGLYYRPYASEDGKTLTLIKYTSKLGRIETARGAIESLGMFSQQNQFDAISNSRSVSVPEGEYSIVEAHLRIAGADRKDYLVSYRKDRGSQVRVDNAKAVFLAFDDAPSPAANAYVNGRYVSLHFSLTDSNGWRVTSIQIPATTGSTGSILGDPIIEITDSSGSVQSKGTMIPSWQGRYYNWMPTNTAAPGTYTARIRWQTGAFGEVSAKTTFLLK